MEENMFLNCKVTNFFSIINFQYSIYFVPLHSTIINTHCISEEKEQTIMNKGSLLLVPSGGLANRMRAIASAYNLSQTTGSNMQVIWFQDWALKAPFYSIFKPIEHFKVIEAKRFDYLLYDRARRHNLWIPALPQKILFERHINEKSITPLKRQGFDFEQWAYGHRCYMSCYQVFGNFPESLYSKLFHPVKEVMEGVNGFREQFSSHCIGLHIRRTDNAESIQHSPTPLFINKIKAEIETHADTTVFLATDSDDVKQELRNLFGQRIITPNKAASRNSIDGIRGGLVDMWTLASTQKIYGSAGSTFSPMAASIGNTELVIVTK